MDGNDVGWPLTAHEAHARAWSHAGEACLLDPAYLAVERKLQALSGEATRISQALDQTAIKAKADFAVL